MYFNPQNENHNIGLFSNKTKDWALVHERELFCSIFIMRGLHIVGFEIQALALVSNSTFETQVIASVLSIKLQFSGFWILRSEYSSALTSGMHIKS